MAASRRWHVITAFLGLASLAALPACDSDRPRVLLNRATPAPSPSATAAAPVATSKALMPSPTLTPTRTRTAVPTATPTTGPGRAVTPVKLPAVTETPLSTPTKAATATPLRVHIVRYGETLAGIARVYGTTATAIASLNNLASVNRIYPGQRLLIP